MCTSCEYKSGQEREIQEQSMGAQGGKRLNSQRGTHHRLVVEVVLEGLLAGGEGLRDLVAGVVVLRRGELGRELGLERAVKQKRQCEHGVAQRVARKRHG